MTKGAIETANVALRIKLVTTFILSVFLLMTNRWLSHEDGIRIMAADDTQSSMSIALAAPAFPGERLPFHHAQRFAVSYVIGLAAKAIPVSAEVWFMLGTLLCCAAIVGVYLKILDRLKTTIATQFVLLSLLMLNPYSFRYYLAVPGLTYDLVFVLGLSWSLLGLLENQFSKVFMGLTLASLARQTGLLMLPGLSVWIFFGSVWRERSLSFKAAAVGSLTVCSLIVYYVTGQIASQFATQSTNLEHLTRIFEGNRNAFAIRAVAEIVVRAVIPMAFPIGILFGIYMSTSRRPTLTCEFSACLLFSFFITLQPFLGGGTNITRLSAIGLLPCFTALGMVLRETQVFDQPQSLPLALLQTLIVFGSFHHMYTYIGGEMTLALRFSTIYFSLAAAAGYLSYVINKSKSGMGAALTQSLVGT